MKYASSKRNQNGHGKSLFILMLVILVFAIIFLAVTQPPDFESCENGEVSTKCACPSDQDYIGKKNIVFVDVTDQISGGKVEDINNLIERTAFRQMGMIEWISGGKKIEKTSVYMLADKKPIEMAPIATYCSLPPAITLILQFPGDEVKRIKQIAQKTILDAISKIKAQTSTTHSYIVEGLAVATSNSSSWKPGSKLILISDLFENSSSCGYFENESVPNFQNIKSECKRWVEIIGENLRQNSSISSGKSTVAVCQILSKKPKEGLVAFWRNLFQSELKYDILLTCNPDEINERSKYLN